MNSVLSVDADPPGSLRLASFELDLRRGELRGPDGAPAELRKQALEVLLALATDVGHVVTKADLMQRVWPDDVVTEDSLVQAIADIRRVLGDNEHRLVRTVQRRGYLLTSEVANDDASAGAIPTAASDSSRIATSRRPARIAWAGGLAVAAILVMVGWAVQQSPAPTREPPQIAVLAFRDRAGTEEGAMLARGVAEHIIMELGRNQGLNVVAHHSSFAVSDKGLPVTEIGRRLRAQYLIDGLVERNGERLQLEVQLIDARAEKVLWVSRHETEGGGVVHALDEVLGKVSGTLFSKVRESEKQRAAGASPKSLDVYALTQNGHALKHRFAPEATREARTTLERVLATDPNYGPAWWALGWLNAVDVHFGLTSEWGHFERMPEAVAQINRGIELDPNASGAWQALMVAYVGIPGANEQALAAAQRAIELGPGDAEAWLFHSIALLGARAPAEALRSVERAMAMNPIPPVYFTAIHAQVLWPNEQYEAARRTAEDCLRKAPLYRPCRVVMIIAEGELGGIDAARAQFAALGVQANGYSATLACAPQYQGSAPVFERCVKWMRAAGLPP
ncbi:winged helix-turn-helix domain-containing protein [Variovorax sp. J22R133]|uniref:winged helix-turn-helix domain-containing protein n=1 Tax=Variovorax brevis TaxID=3053503 RepID=UPI002574D116|nr:winged helix-turn-helix domain-containing protein [Variovorax sp. J22R133]MDM0114375.1 winged helix-turn-helix domain-containing protein [Variovorax sp. J22R133]